MKKPTPWVSQLYTTKKKDSPLRICLDSHELKKALLREHYTMSILNALYDHKDTKIFTKVDLSSGYWHVKLENASRDLFSKRTLSDLAD